MTSSREPPLQKKVNSILAKNRCHLRTEVIFNVERGSFVITGTVYCNRTYDGFGCWNDTLAGQQAVIYCPELHGFNSSRKCIPIN